KWGRSAGVRYAPRMTPPLLEFVDRWSSGVGRAANFATLALAAVSFALMLAWLVARARPGARARHVARTLKLAFLGTGWSWFATAFALRAIEPVHSAWTILLLLPSALGVAGVLAAAAWLLAFGRIEREDACGGCAHTIEAAQSTCPECGWCRGEPALVRERRLEALGIGAGVATIAAGVALVAIAWLPLEWHYAYDATLRAILPSGYAAEILEVSGEARQRFVLGSRGTRFEPEPIGPLVLGRPTARFSFTTLEILEHADPASVDATYRADIERGVALPAGQANSMLITMPDADPLAQTKFEMPADATLGSPEFLAETSLAFLRGILGDRAPKWPAPLESARVTVLYAQPSWSTVLLPCLAAGVGFAVVARRGWRRASAGRA
ncbi:MAG: hypothetical protein RI967_95, partial [Planctomycetota bacterium]